MDVSKLNFIYVHAVEWYLPVSWHQMGKHAKVKHHQGLLVRKSDLANQMNIVEESRNGCGEGRRNVFVAIHFVSDQRTNSSRVKYNSSYTTAPTTITMYGLGASTMMHRVKCTPAH